MAGSQGQRTVSEKEWPCLHHVQGLTRWWGLLTNYRQRLALEAVSYGGDRRLGCEFVEVRSRGLCGLRTASSVFKPGVLCWKSGLCCDFRTSVSTGRRWGS